uniref:Large ribosomal subunit protein bL35c n=1 Tax=Dichotomaria marginata TaxID=268567 RepID=A0A1G4NST1_9FLOR|nr:Ribosomal protein L35 [Dichotomaria marginata]SCW21569.1 Ribosomal protein L35 [Dichotomaria marginata]
MTKKKTSSAIKKRFKITGSGKLLHHQAGLNHLLQKKTQKRKKRLARIVEVTPTVIQVLKQKIRY